MIIFETNIAVGAIEAARAKAMLLTGQTYRKRFPRIILEITLYKGSVNIAVTHNATNETVMVPPWDEEYTAVVETYGLLDYCSEDEKQHMQIAGMSPKTVNLGDAQVIVYPDALTSLNKRGSFYGVFGQPDGGWMLVSLLISGGWDFEIDGITYSFDSAIATDFLRQLGLR